MHTAHTPSKSLSIGWMLNVYEQECEYVCVYMIKMHSYICHLYCCCCHCHCCYCCLNSYHSMLYSVRPVAVRLLESSTMCSNECESKCFYSLIRYIHTGCDVMYGICSWWLQYGCHDTRYFNIMMIYDGAGSTCDEWFLFVSFYFIFI